MGEPIKHTLAASCPSLSEEYLLPTIGMVELEELDWARELDGEMSKEDNPDESTLVELPPAKLENEIKQDKKKGDGRRRLELARLRAQKNRMKKKTLECAKNIR